MNCELFFSTTDKQVYSGLVVKTVPQYEMQFPTPHPESCAVCLETYLLRSQIKKCFETNITGPGTLNSH